VENSASSLYDSLDLGVAKRMSSRYQLEAHYLWSSSANYSMFFGEPKDGETCVFLYRGDIEMDSDGENGLRIGDRVGIISLALLKRVCPGIYRDFGFELSSDDLGDSLFRARVGSDPRYHPYGTNFRFGLLIGLIELELAIARAQATPYNKDDGNCRLCGDGICLLGFGNQSGASQATNGTPSTTTSDTEHTGDTAATTTSPEDAACDHPTGASHQSGAAVTDDQA